MMKKPSKYLKEFQKFKWIRTHLETGATSVRDVLDMIVIWKDTLMTIMTTIKTIQVVLNALSVARATELKPSTTTMSLNASTLSLPSSNVLLAKKTLQKEILRNTYVEANAVLIM